MQIFLININDFSDQNYNLCLSLMDEKRRQYIHSLKHQKGKLLSVAAEWLVKTNASTLLNKNIEEIVLLRDEKGKPYIKDNPVYISISHSGDFAAAAFHNSPVGIDIEVLRPVDIRLKNRICTNRDLVFRGCARENFFFPVRRWTVQENRSRARYPCGREGLAAV